MQVIVLLTSALYDIRPQFTGKKSHPEQPDFKPADWFAELGLTPPQTPMQPSRWIKPQDTQPTVLGNQLGKKQVQYDPNLKKWRLVDLANSIKKFNRP
jgi:hypothetical protein